MKDFDDDFGVLSGDNEQHLGVLGVTGNEFNFYIQLLLSFLF